MAKKEERKSIEIKPVHISRLIVTIKGDSDLVLNKMSDYTTKILANPDVAKTLEKPNIWENIITSMHWYNGKPQEFSEESLLKNLDPKVNAPCISGFGLKKSFGDAVVRNEIDKYKTKFDANVNVIARDNLVPVRFAEHYIDKKLMSPKKGHPVLTYLNRFCDWSADFEIMISGLAYSEEQVINIINLAGFGLGIGSGRSSGYGRYHVENVATAE